MEYVKKDCEKGGFGNPEGMGVLSDNPLTNIKYHFVVATGMIARYCIEYGMEMEQAFHLSDFYIKKMDRCTAIPEVIDIHTQMCLDYMGKMRLLRNEKALSKPIQECIQYIYVKTNEKIELEEMAQSVGLSKNYLYRLFHKEVGISITDYIHTQKIQKAQNLLKYCDYSYIEIANYLGFSSQSHFIDVFRKYTGVTPKKYRDKYYHTMW